MELLIPSLAVILLTTAVIYYIMPLFAVTVLVGGSVLVLLATAYYHYTKFGVAEYERATWQFNLRKYAGLVMVAFILMAAYGFWALNNTSGAALPQLFAGAQSPALGPPMMPAVGGGFDTVMKRASSRVGELMRRGRISYD
jgi:hypothetical protein